MVRKPLTDEQRRRKQERDRARRRLKKDAINAKDRERRKRQKEVMTDEERKAHNERAAKRMKASRDCKAGDRKEKERAANRDRMKKKRENETADQKQQRRVAEMEGMRKRRKRYTPHEREKEQAANRTRMRIRRDTATQAEKQAERAANSIRNTLAKKVPGSRLKLDIKQLKPNLTEEEKLRINAYRNMLMTRHSLPIMQNKAQLAYDRVKRLRAQKERATALTKDGTLPKRYLTVASRELRKAYKNYDIRRALESEREFMQQLAQEIYNLTIINPNQPYTTKRYLCAKRNLLQLGFELALSLREVEKSLKVVQKETKAYEIQQVRNKEFISKLTRQYKSDIQSIAERKKNISSYDSSENIRMTEQQHRDNYEMNKIHSYNKSITKFESLLENVKDTHKKACLVAEELQKKHASAESELDDAFRVYTEYMEDEEYELIKKEYLEASGVTCEKCRMRWFWNRNIESLFDHEKVCKGMDNDLLTHDINKEKQSLSEEDVASDFINQRTGQYRSVTDGVPEYLNHENGHYKFGWRKCSHCNEFKYKNNFTEEEANKKADKRVCYCCMEIM